LNRQALLTIDEDIGQARHYKFPSAHCGPTATHLGELVQTFAGCPDRLGNSVRGLGIIGGDVFKHDAQVFCGGYRPYWHLTPRIY